MYRRLISLTSFTLFLATAALAQQIVPVEGHDDVRLLNRSRFDAVMVALRFESDGHSAAIPPAIRLQPGEEIILENVVETLFGLTTDTAGEISVDGPEVVEVEWRVNRAKASEEWAPAILAAPGGRRRPVRAAPSPRPELPTLVQVGDTATFSGSHGVSGTATLVAKNVIRLTSLRHDGSAPGLDIRVGLSTTSRKNFTVLRVTGREAFRDATLELTLPDSVDLNSFDTLTVWCYEFNSVIAEGRFRRQ